tara:strand:+ start:2959 stop:3660 length:702 start_codon:yes stop_codon:yes gene_type:complete
MVRFQKENTENNVKINLIIPARGFTPTFENKNFYKIGNKTLLEMVCEKALKCKYFNDIYVDTESEHVKSSIAHLTLRGLKILNRPKELTCDSITASDMMIYGLHSVSECDVLVQTFSTTPLLTSETIDMCIKKFIDSYNSHDSFVTVYPMKEYLWENKTNPTPANFNADRQLRISEMEEILVDTHGLYGIKVEELLENKNRIGKSPMLIEIPKIESYHINDDQDLEIINRIIN